MQMHKLRIPPGITLRKGSIPKLYDNLSVIEDSEELIYDQTYSHAIMNDRIIKVLKSSIVYERI